MPLGRGLEDLRDLPIKIVREKSSVANSSEKSSKSQTNLIGLSESADPSRKYGSLVSKSLSALENEKKASSIRPMEANGWLSASSGSFYDEKPRTPPIAAAQIQIETITVNSEDTFFNDEFTFLESSGSNNSSKVTTKKFLDLPNLLIEQEKPSSSLLNGFSSSSSCFSNENISQTPQNEKGQKKTKKAKPKCQKHLSTRKRESTYAKRRYLAPEDKCGLKLSSLIGYNGKNSTQNVIWCPEKEFFAFTIGSVLCVEDLKSGKQKILSAHQEDITVISQRNDNSQIASASAYSLLTKSANNDLADLSLTQCQIILWNCSGNTIEMSANLFHKNASNINSMKFSYDDRFLATIGDYKLPSLNIWNIYDQSLIARIDELSFVVNDMCWNPSKCNEFVLCGENRTLTVWNLEEKPMRNGSLRSYECEVPLIIIEVRLISYFNFI